MARKRAYGSIRKSDQKGFTMRFHPAVLAQIERQAKRHGLSAGRWAEATIESIATGALTVTNA